MKAYLRIAALAGIGYMIGYTVGGLIEAYSLRNEPSFPTPLVNDSYSL